MRFAVLLFLIVLGCGSQTSTSSGRTNQFAFSYQRKDMVALRNLSAAELAQVVEIGLNSETNQRNFLSSNPTPPVWLNWSHGSNGALWEGLFEPARTDGVAEILASFVRISQTMCRVVEKSPKPTPDERRSGLLAIGLGVSRCSAYVKSRSFDGDKVVILKDLRKISKEITQALKDSEVTDSRIKNIQRVLSRMPRRFRRFDWLPIN